MKKYEGLFVFPAESSDDFGAEIESWLKKFNGKVLQKNDLGKKVLTSSVKKFREGRMIVTDLEIDPAQIKPLRNMLELQENLISYMISIPEKKKDAPTPYKEPEIEED